jgi:hypothetical protein
MVLETSDELVSEAGTSEKSARALNCDSSKEIDL